MFKIKFCGKISRLGWDRNIDGKAAEINIARVSHVVNLETCKFQIHNADVGAKEMLKDQLTRDNLSHAYNAVVNLLLLWTLLTAKTALCISRYRAKSRPC